MTRSGKYHSSTRNKLLGFQIEAEKGGFFFGERVRGYTAAEKGKRANALLQDYLLMDGWLKMYRRRDTRC